MPLDLELDESQDTQSPFRGTLTSFGSITDGKIIKRTPFTLQGTGDGAVWTTIPSDQYTLWRKVGLMEKRILDDSANDVDWSTYTDWQEAGHQAFRATYTVKDNSTSPVTTTTYTNESVTFADVDDSSGQGDGSSVNVAVPQNLVVQEIHAEFGFIGNWDINATYLALDTGTNSTSAGMSPSDYPFFGGATYANRATAPFRVTTAGALVASSATITGSITATSGAIGGWTIGATALTAGSGATTVALDSGGTNPAFYAGSATPTSAPVQIYNSGYIFAQDIVLAKGSLTNASGATGYGYAVNPLLMCHFDGQLPYYQDYRGNANGVAGEVGTYKWGSTVGFGTFFQGIYGKAVSVAEATTNLITNPSFETNTTGWVQANGTDIAQDTTYSLFGTHSLKGRNTGSGNNVPSYNISLTNGTTYTFSCWVYIPASQPTLTAAAIRFQDGSFVTQASTNFLTQANATRDQWFRVAVTWAATSTATFKLNFGFSANSAHAEWIDGAQCEAKAYVTPYCDGSLGLFPGQLATASEGVTINGYQWSSTNNASTSSRLAATLTYPAAGNIMLTQGSVSFWYYQNPSVVAASIAFGVRIDANNLLEVRLSPAGALTPIALSISASSSVDTNSSPTAASAGWHHICATWTSGALILYLDGVKSGSTANYAIPVGSPSTIEVGSVNSANQANTLIDDFCILPIVLSAHEVASIYYSDAPLMLAVSNQEWRVSDPAGGEILGNANGIFARGDDGTASFALINVAGQNASAWGGASESPFDAGDFMFGSNASGKSNLKWDASSGELDLRIGTTKKVSADTNGTVLIGSNVASHATTAMAVFSSSLTYNSESMVSGDILFGDNSLSNIKIDSSGGFHIRSGTNDVVTAQNSGVQITKGTLSLVQASASVTSGTVDLDTGGGTLSASYVRITGNGSNWTLRGISNNASGIPDGTILYVLWESNGGGNMTITSGGSPAAGYSPIVTMDGTITPVGNTMMTLIYNSANSRWDLISLRDSTTTYK